MKNLLHLKIILLLLILSNCNLPKEDVVKVYDKEDVLAKNPKAFDPSVGMGKVMFTKDLMEIGLDMPELKYNLTDEKIKDIVKTILNEPGTTRDEMKKAMTLYHRMKKEDYEKAHILYLKNHPMKFKQKIEFYKTVFKHAKKYKESFERLPEETQHELMLLAMEEIKKSN